MAESPPEPNAAGRRLVELRIHGVSGTPAERMLDVPIVEREAGDDDAGFWRGSSALVAPSGPRRRFVREGYRWGGLTSRTGLRALWVLLAPFALANTAAAMHLPGNVVPIQRRGIAGGAEGAVVRLFALSLTLTMVLAAFVTTVDLVGWQCGNSEACRTGHSVTRFLDWDWMATPGKRLTGTTLGPLLVVGILWFLARKTWQRFESYPPGPDTERKRATPFDTPKFWDGRTRTETLRHLHIAGAFAMCAGLLAYVLRTTPAGNASELWPTVLMWSAAGLSLPIVALVVVPATNATRRVASVTLVASALVLVVTLAYAWFGPELDPRARHQLPGTATAVTVLFGAQLALVVVLVGEGLSRKLWRKPRAPGVGLWGCGTACMATIALFLGGAFSAGVILRTAEFLGKTQARGEAPDPDAIVTPNAITWAARGVVIALILVALHLVIMGACYLFIWSKRRSDVDVPPPTRTDTDPEDQAARRHERLRRRNQVAAAIARARLMDRVGLIAGPLVFIGLLIVLTTAVFAVLADVGRGPGFIHDQAAGWQVWTVSVGSWLIVGVAVALVALMSRAYRDAGLRRVVGILWDLATFWPRSAHPLAPPCYGERTVPEFAGRVAYFGAGDSEYPDEPFKASDEVSDVIVSAHSQGSIIATAALLQVRNAPYVALLTYGCPLRRLYSKYFPAYFDLTTLGELRDRVGGRWRNLYRKTDPIGGPVETPPGDDARRAPELSGVDVLVEIPMRRRPGDTVYPPIEAHSNYTQEPDYTDALRELDLLLVPGTHV